MPPAGGRWVVQAAQADGHLLQGRSLGFTLTGDQLRLQDRQEPDMSVDIMGNT